MSDPVTNVEIEDVLSSIRRLVSQDVEARVAPSVAMTKAHTEPQEPAALILTEDHRIDGSDGQGNGAADPPPSSETKIAALSDAQKQAAKAVRSELERAIEELEASMGIADGGAPPTSVAPAAAEGPATPVAGDARPQEARTAATDVDFEARDEKRRVEATGDARGQGDPGDPSDPGAPSGDHSKGSTLERELDALEAELDWEAPVGQKMDGPAPDRSEDITGGTPDTPDAAPETPREAEPLFEPEAPMVEAVTSAEEQQPLAFTSLREARPATAAIEALQLVAVSESAHQDADYEEDASVPPHLMAKSASGAPSTAARFSPRPGEEEFDVPQPPFDSRRDDHFPGFGPDAADLDLEAGLDRDVAIDPDMLRELVSEIVRKELQGELGERITRNVRKLVRREINRALAGQDLI